MLNNTTRMLKAAYCNAIKKIQNKVMWAERKENSSNFYLEAEAGSIFGEYEQGVLAV